MLNKKIILLIGVFALSLSVVSAQFKYIGAAKCKMCHKSPDKGDQYKQWSESKHAHAMESLKDDEKKDPKCLKCHSTAAAVDQSLLSGLTIEEGVSCESCHGPGSDYKPMAIMKDRNKSMEKGLILPTEQMCVTCHNAESPTFKGFDYATYLEKVKHDNPQTK